MARSSELQRQLDFWVGVPLVYLASIVRRRRCLPDSPKKVAILSPSAIGDLILASGVLVRIREAYPHAAIHIFHAATNAGAIPLIPVEVVSHLCDFVEVGRTVSELRRGRFDLVIDLTPWSRLTALFAAASGAPTVGFCTRGQFRHYAFDVAIPHLQSRHEIENLSALAQVFASDKPYLVRVRRNFPTPRLPAEARRVILCHTGPGGSRAREKSWPIAYWIELAGGLVAQGYSVGFTGTNADRVRVDKIVDALRMPADSVFSLCGKLSLGELVGALASCRLCVTIDTSVVHLAAAVGIPTVALFGASSSSRWGARSAVSVNLDAPHPYAGYVSLGFERRRGALQIMPELRVDAVRTAIESLLKQTG